MNQTTTLDHRLWHVVMVMDYHIIDFHRLRWTGFWWQKALVINYYPEEFRMHLATLAVLYTLFWLWKQLLIVSCIQQHPDEHCSKAAMTKHIHITISQIMITFSDKCQLAKMIEGWKLGQKCRPTEALVSCSLTLFNQTKSWKQNSLLHDPERFIPWLIVSITNEGHWYDINVSGLYEKVSKSGRGLYFILHWH